MIVTERRERRRLALRQSILDAARVLVRDEGLAGLTMRRIADAIDYAPASLYAHFASREALLAALCLEGLEALRLALEAALSAKEPRRRLVALGTAYVKFALEHPDTYRLIFMENAELTKGVFESLDSDDGTRALTLLVAQFEELRAAGVLRKAAKPAQLADLFWMVVHGLASLRIACPALPGTDDSTLIATAIATIVEGSRALRSAR